MHKKLKIPLNLPFEKGERKMKNFFLSPRPLMEEDEGMQEVT